MQAMYCRSQVSIFHQPVYWDLFRPYLLGGGSGGGAGGSGNVNRTRTRARREREPSRRGVSAPLSVSGAANRTCDKR